MVEAEITCDCTAIQLADLQVALTKGMVVYLDANQARASRDLQRAIRAKGVTVKYVQRFRERRPEPVLPPASSPSLPSIPPAQETLPVGGPNIEEIASRIADIVTSRMVGVLNQALRSLVEGNFPRSDEGYHAPIIQRMVPAVQEDVPVFIPSKIGRDDLQPVEVAAAEGEAGSVAEAVAALTAARKGKDR